jgi:hypothetical protein
VWDEYTREKLNEFERERLRIEAKRPHLEHARTRGERRVLGPVARAAGRRVRRLGEAIEGWAAAPQRGASL